MTRNSRILEMAAEGHPHAAIAETFGISKSRVSQIISEHYEEITDDGSRDWARAILEGYLGHIQKLVNGPGKRFVSPSGRPVYEIREDGSFDFDRPLYDEYAKRELIDAGVKVVDRLSRLYALDKPKLKEKDESPEFEQAMEYVRQLASEKKELLAKLEQYGEEPKTEFIAEVIEDDSDQAG